MTPLTVSEARALLVADEALESTYEARLNNGTILNLEEMEAWIKLVASARERIATYRGTNRIEQAFGIPRVLLPVIHPISREAALESIRVVRGAGCRGIFLIDQGMREDDVLRLVYDVRVLDSALWVGVNLLRRRPAVALHNALSACYQRIDGIWSDDAGIDERRPQETAAAEEFNGSRKAFFDWPGLYFGGVAFKYQREVLHQDLPHAAALAVQHMDVVCTSGPGTGQPIAIEKLIALRSGLGDTALALASGVTTENVQSFLPYVQAFLVGTGIEKSLGVIDATKVNALRIAIEEKAA